MNSLVKTIHGYYKLRIRVYKKLVPYFNRLEINKSLKTKNKSEAKLKATLILNKYLTLKLYSELNTTEEYLKTSCQTFITDILENNKSTSYKPLQPTHTYIKTIDDFCLYYNSKDISLTTRNSVLSFFQSVFIHLINKKSEVKETTLNDLIKIKNIIENLPSRNLKQYKSVPIKKLIEIKIKKEDRLSFGRVESCIKYIKRFFKYCESHQIITYNPATFISMTSTISPLEERESYTKEEMKTLLSIVDSIKDENKQAIFYTLAYTGMRLSELWKASIKSKNDIYYFDLTDKKQILKNRSSYRIIPFHDILITKGIHLILPLALTEVKQSSISHYFSRNIKSNVSCSDRKVMYSMRHTLATQLKYAEVNPLVISELLGHTHEGMTMGRYASRYPLEILKEAIDKLVYN